MRLPNIIIKVNSIAVIRLFKRYILGIKPRPVRNFGLLRDSPDPRDFCYKLQAPGRVPASTERKNISQFPWRYDQGQLGSCWGNGAVEAYRRALQVNGMSDYEASRLFAYWIARQDKVNDTGTSPRDGFKALAKYGICSEKSWPYLIDKFAVTPPPEAFTEALDHQALRYERIYPVSKIAIMDAVAQGYPVGYGKELYESFMTNKVAELGIVPMPRRCHEQLMGRHWMTIFDYDEDGTIELNSWGREWGLDGTCHVPWRYVLDAKLCSDFWVLYKTE